MTNCAMDVKGDILTITVDLSKRYDPSKSGKTIIVASTNGNIAAPEHSDIKIGLNVYAKGDKKE